MSRIRILPELIANRIAAGEVVERPASVLKELVDNAMDAGALRISVKVEGAGVDLVEVSDNGCGMGSDDALMSLETHATSKITAMEDLDSISTYGFRGEALPSISSVSRLSITTRRAEDLEGTRISCDGGRILRVEPVGCPPGTTITVCDLFHNLPARRKFLRSARTEEQHLEAQFISLALSRLDRHMELRLNGRLAQSFAACSSWRERSLTVFGRETVRDMLAVHHEEQGLRIQGLMGRPGMARAANREQYFFVNARPVVAREFSSALRQAFEGLVGKGMAVPCLIHIEMDPARVDVNVHPAKREVRFREPQLITSILANAFTLALRQLAGHMGPAAQQSLEASASLRADAPQQLRTFTRPAWMPSVAPTLAPAAHTPAPATPTVAPAAHTSALTAPTVAPAAAEHDLAALSPVPPQAQGHGLERLRYIGYVGRRYLLCHSDAGLVVLSVSAARARIFFEELLANLEGASGVQQLLIPISMELSRSEIQALQQHLPSLLSMGLGLREFGPNTWILSHVPQSFPGHGLEGLLRELLDQLSHSGRNAHEEQRRIIAKALAAAAAQLCGEAPGAELAQSLLLRLDRTRTPYVCPQGRPVIISIAEGELDRRFGLRG